MSDRWSLPTQNDRQTICKTCAPSTDVMNWLITRKDHGALFTASHLFSIITSLCSVLNLVFKKPKEAIY
jgi:hypothetical protein